MQLWFVLFWGIFLFFYAGSYRYGADVRFALLSFMPLAVLAGIGGEALRIEKKGQRPFSPECRSACPLPLCSSWSLFSPG